LCMLPLSEKASACNAGTTALYRSERMSTLPRPACTGPIKSLQFNLHHRFWAKFWVLRQQMFVTQTEEQRAACLPLNSRSPDDVVPIRSVSHGHWASLLFVLAHRTRNRTLL
jgi:hypothetical protein